MKKTILFADDNDDFSSTFKEFFSKNPWDIDLAENGVVALDKAMARKFDLIILDINMPFMNGTDTLKAIKLQWQNIPILAFTGDLTFERRKELISDGFSDVIQKPIELFKLNKIIEYFLNPGQAQNPNQQTKSVDTSTTTPTQSEIKTIPLSPPITPFSTVKPNIPPPLIAPEILELSTKPSINPSAPPLNKPVISTETNQKISPAIPASLQANQAPSLLQNYQSKTINSNNLDSETLSGAKPPQALDVKVNSSAGDSSLNAKIRELEEKIKIVMASKLVLQEEINKLRKENDFLRSKLSNHPPKQPPAQTHVNLATPSPSESKMDLHNTPRATPLPEQNDESVPTFELD